MKLIDRKSHMKISGVSSNQEREMDETIKFVDGNDMCVRLK